MSGANPAANTNIWATAQRLRDVRDASQRFLRLWVMQHSISRAMGDPPTAPFDLNRDDARPLDSPPDFDD